MLRIKNKRANIPNGYLYVQRETGFDVSKVMPHTINDFYAVAQAIRQHRMANPQFKLSTSMPAIEEELERTNAARIAAIPGAAAVYLMEVGGAPPSFQVPPQSIAVKLVSAVEALKTGKEATDDWLDSETPPVLSEVSRRRAETCVRCPLNSMGSLSRWFTIPAAAFITRRLEKLHARKLSTPFDNQLGTCEACLCRNQLKVHEPLELVLKHTSEEIKAKLDKNCWILSENAFFEKESA